MTIENVEDYDKEKYPTGGSPFLSKEKIMIERTFVSPDIFIISSKVSGDKQAPSLKRLRKLSKYYNSLASKIYNNYLDNFL
jgi:hypothetical protein